MTSNIYRIAYQERKACPACGDKILKHAPIARVLIGNRACYVHAACADSDTVEADASQPEAAPAPILGSDAEQRLAALESWRNEHDVVGTAMQVIEHGVQKVRTWAEGAKDEISKRGDSVQVRVDRNVAEIIERKLAERIPQRIVLVREDSEVELEDGELHHECFAELCELIGDRENINLVGPTGSGKTHIVGQAAKALDMEFGFLSCTVGTTEGHITGRLLPAAGSSVDTVESFNRLVGEAGLPDVGAAAVVQAESNAMFRFVGTEFLRCYEGGGVFLLDEMDAMDANVLLVVNSAISNGVCAVPNRPEAPVAHRHDDFVLVAACNTWGKGADRQFVGRNQLDESTLRRFRFGTIEMDYDTNVERALCPDATLFDKLVTLREKIRENQLERTVTTADFDRGFHHLTRLRAKGHTDVTAYAWIMRKMTMGYSHDEKQRTIGV